MILPNRYKKDRGLTETAINDIVKKEFSAIEDLCRENERLVCLGLLEKKKFYNATIDEHFVRWEDIEKLLFTPIQENKEL